MEQNQLKPFIAVIMDVSRNGQAFIRRQKATDTRAEALDWVSDMMDREQQASIEVTGKMNPNLGYVIHRVHINNSK